MVPSTSLCNLSCVNCSTDDLKGYVVMLASFAFLDKYTCCQSSATPWPGYWPMLLSVHEGREKPTGDKACDIQWMLCNSQFLIYMDPGHEYVSNLSLLFLVSEHQKTRCALLTSSPISATTVEMKEGGLAFKIIYSNLPAWRRCRNKRFLESVGLHCCKWGHHLALDQANSSLWMAFGRKQKSTPKTDCFLYIANKSVYSSKSWRGAIKDFREFASENVVLVILE